MENHFPTFFLKPCPFCSARFYFQSSRFQVTSTPRSLQLCPAFAVDRLLVHFNRCHATRQNSSWLALILTFSPGRRNRHRRSWVDGWSSGISSRGFSARRRTILPLPCPPLARRRRIEARRNQNRADGISRAEAQRRSAADAATKFPLAPESRRGAERAEKDQDETPFLVFSASLRLCAKKSLREKLCQKCATFRYSTAEKDQEETPCLVFSASLRLCAKRSLQECVDSDGLQCKELKEERL